MAEDFLARAHQFFLSRGYPPHAAAALAANAIAESGGNTRAEHDKGTGVGIYGFRDPTPGTGRKTALFNFAKARGLDPYAEFDAIGVCCPGTGDQREEGGRRAQGVEGLPRSPGCDDRVSAASFL